MALPPLDTPEQREEFAHAVGDFIMGGFLDSLLSLLPEEKLAEFKNLKTQADEIRENPAFGTEGNTGKVLQERYNALNAEARGILFPKFETVSR